MDDVNITVKDGDCKRPTSVWLELDEAKRMLGVYQVVCYNNTIQVKEMWNIAERWYEK